MATKMRPTEGGPLHARAVRSSTRRVDRLENLPRGAAGREPPKARRAERRARSQPPDCELILHADLGETRGPRRAPRFQLEIARRDIPGLWPPPDDAEYRLEPGDTVESVRELYEGILAENRAILAEVTDLDSLSTINLNRRWVVLHLIEELARHAGHADLIRESIDGSKGT